MNIINISRNLIALRQQKDWTQEDVAKKLGYSRGAVQKWESGMNEPNLSAIQKIMELYDVTMDRLVFEPMEYREEPEKLMLDEVVDRVMQRFTIKMEGLQKMERRDRDVYAEFIKNREYRQCEESDGETIREAIRMEGIEASCDKDYNAALKCFEELAGMGDLSAILSCVISYYDMMQEYEKEGNDRKYFTCKMELAYRLIQYGNILKSDVAGEREENV